VGQLAIFDDIWHEKLRVHLRSLAQSWQ